MELIALTTLLTLANIFGVQAVTQAHPVTAFEHPQATAEELGVAKNESTAPKSLFDAVVKFKKEKGLI